ncbi:MAG: thiol-disulfide oxidoreductase DCC family protein [Rudaea sp.]|nr:thiol-disulfide oxidoreductase DCC family protein [Rudaea sp.]
MSSDNPVLVFDGVCVLCNRSVQFVLRHDRARRFRFATNESASGRALMIRHGLDPAAPVSVLLVEDGRAHVESAAVVRVLAGFGGGWRIAAATLHLVPTAIRDHAYRYVARHRYRWFGRREVCWLPDPRDAGRFLP